ncbi:MAG TPA: hypothetical protein VMM79_00855 [Longimicrobiales bacterium]|nr:hypothetical protein [Longimicrobiales bacterium]
MGPTNVLFPATAYAANAVHRQYDVSPDGARFLMIRRKGADGRGRLILVQNFFEELRTRVPG